LFLAFGAKTFTGAVTQPITIFSLFVCVSVFVFRRS